MRFIVVLLIILVSFAGCEKDRLIDTGPVIIDRDLLPKEVETNHENR